MKLYSPSYIYIHSFVALLHNIIMDFSTLQYANWLNIKLHSSLLKKNRSPTCNIHTCLILRQRHFLNISCRLIFRQGILIRIYITITFENTSFFYHRDPAKCSIVSTLEKEWNVGSCLRNIVTAACAAWISNILYSK